MYTVLLQKERTAGDVLKNWTNFEKIWIVTFSIFGIALSLYWRESVVGVIAFLTGILCVVLVAKGSIWNYAFGIINTIAYAYIAFGYKLYGEVMLNMIYYLPMQFVGYYLWKNNMKKTEVNMKKLTLKKTVIMFVVVAIAIILYQRLLLLLGGNLTLLDSMSTVVSVIAMILMALRYKEQWLLWIIVNIVSVIMWIVSKDYVMALMWLAYLINAVYGYFNWSKGSQEVKEDNA